MLGRSKSLFTIALGVACWQAMVFYSHALSAQVTGGMLTTQYAQCPGVSSAVVHPLQLGSFRLRTGDSGWIYLDGRGDVYASAAVSTNPAFPASNGVIRIRGPQHHRVHIELAIVPWRLPNEPQQGTEMADIFTVHSLQVFSRDNTIVEHMMNNEYVVVLPAAQDAAYSEVELFLGLEAHVTVMSSPQQIATSVQLRCLGIENQ